MNLNTIGDSNNDPESTIGKSIKNKMASRKSYYILLTLITLIFLMNLFVVLKLLDPDFLSKYINGSKTKEWMESKEKKICTSDQCVRSASIFIESMNKTADPCEDFYQFACGNYALVNRLPKIPGTNNRFNELNSVLLTIIRDFLEKKNGYDEPKPILKARNLYHSCIATDKMDVFGSISLFELLDKIGLPYLGFNTNHSEENKTYSNLTSILARVKKYVDIGYLFQISIEADYNNDTINRIWISQPNDEDIIFPICKTKEKTEIKKENDDEKYVKNVWMEIYKYQKNYSYPPNQESWNKLEQLICLPNEKSLIFNQMEQKNSDESFSDEKSPITMTIKEFQIYSDQITKPATPKEHIIDWKEYLSVLFVGLEDVTLDFDKDVITIVDIEYFDALFKILVEPHETLVFHLWWKVIEKIIPYSTNHLRLIRDAYEKKFGKPSRSLECADFVNKNMPQAASYLLVAEEPLPRYKKMMEAMMENIHWAFEKVVDELKWMDDISKNKTKAKARNMKTFIGYPEESIKNRTKFEEFYSDLELKEDDYLGNILRFTQFNLNSKLKKLRQLNDNNERDIWATEPLIVNAVNRIDRNSITLPAGILQFPFFGHDLQVLNYGYFGFIFGHEMTHGFDNNGQMFDQNGNINYFWTEQTIREYANLTECLVDHYGSYLVPGNTVTVDGEYTLGDNIADIGGLKEAFLAYNKFVADNGEEPQLPGLEEFNNKQMYYLAFANVMCETTTKELELKKSRDDDHSPNYIRVIATIANSEEFSDVWMCKKGSKMNPTKEKCKMW